MKACVLALEYTTPVPQRDVTDIFYKEDLHEVSVKSAEDMTIDGKSCRLVFLVALFCLFGLVCLVGFGFVTMKAMQGQLMATKALTYKG